MAESRKQASDPGSSLRATRRGLARGGESSNTPAPTDGIARQLCPSCNTDLSDRAQSQVAQHIRRCIRPAPGDDGMYGCDVCQKRYKSYAGVRQHKKLSHAEQYNQAEVALAEQTGGGRARWTPALEQKLAALELDLPPGTMQKDINLALATSCGKSIDAVKKRRQAASYQLALETVRKEREEQQEKSPSDGSSRPSSPEPDREQSPERPSRSPPFIHVERVDSSCSLISSRSICTTLRSVVANCSPAMASIVNDVLRDRVTLDGLDEALSGFVHTLPGKSLPKLRAKKGVRGARKRGKRQTDRALGFKILQEAYRKNPSHAAKMVLDEAKAPDQVPKGEEVDDFYGKLFGTPADLPEPRGKTSGKIDLSYGISSAEIKQQLRSLKDSAAGPDGVTRGDLRRTNVCDLVAFANLVFGSHRVPAALRVNRTTLLPKSGDLTQVTNWRPVTISSLLLRLIHKVVARRMSDGVPLHCSQRGFSPQDGIMANVHVLQAVIKERKRKAKPLFILSVDLAKAFDKVSPQVIKRGLIRKGIDSHTIGYILSIYEDVTTTISVGSYTSKPIAVKRGVKQGDPTSGILFNIIIDELLSSLKEEHGVEIGREENGEPIRVAGMGFADDTVLIAESPEGMELLIKSLERFLAVSGMEVNVRKCNALQFVKVPTAKRTAVDTRPMFRICGQPVACLSVESQLKYLGLTFDSKGSVHPGPANLQQLLERLRRAALRPWQKLHLLKANLLPRLFHSLQNPAISLKSLKFLDTLVKSFVKAVLHLPKTTPDAFLYARVKDGGFGIPKIALAIPSIYRRRLEKLEEKGDRYVQAALGSQAMQQLLARLRKFSRGVTTAVSYQRRLQHELGETALGGGVAFTSTANGSSWVQAPPPSWKGGDYIKAVQLRCGLLPTRGPPYVRNPELYVCRNVSCARKGVRESLYHVLQRCPVTHWARIERHDALCALLQRDLTGKGYKVRPEPRYRVGGELLKPDLVAISPDGRTAYILELTVAYEVKGSVRKAFTIKAAKYVPIVDKVKGECEVERVRIVPYVVGARGGEHPANRGFLGELGLDLGIQRSLACVALRYGSMIHRQFMSAAWRTTRTQTRRLFVTDERQHYGS